MTEKIENEKMISVGGDAPARPAPVAETADAAFDGRLGWARRA